MIDGQAVQVFPETGDGTMGQSFSVSVSGEAIEGAALPAELGELVAAGTVSAGSVSVVSGVLPADELPEGLQVISAADARQGTPDECAEMLAGMTGLTAAPLIVPPTFPWPS